MTAYLIRRFIQMFIVLIVSSMAIYTLLNMVPGGPFDGLLQNSDRKTRITAEQIKRMEAMLGLDKPPAIRFLAWAAGDDWMGVLDKDWQGTGRGVIRGDFGQSFKEHRPVMEMIGGRIKKTVILTGLSAFLAIIIAVPIGIFSAVRQYSRADYAVTLFTFIGTAIPSFWFALMAIVLFGIKFQEWGLPKLPTKGWMEPRSPRPGTLTHLLGVTPGSYLDVFLHLLLPVAVLSLLQMAGWTRFMRSSMLEVLQQDYVRTARAKGLAERLVVVKHALRNALIPLVTIVTFELPFLFGGTILLEQIFAIPGMGNLYYSGLSEFDWPVVQAYLLITAALTVMATLLSDILYTVVDPRIRLG